MHYHTTHAILHISHGGSFQSISRYKMEKEGEEGKHLALEMSFWSPRNLKVGRALLGKILSEICQF